MTARQRLQLEQSEKRQKINELLAVKPEELSEEQRVDMDTLTKRMQQIEPELRAAIVAEGEEETRAAGEFNQGDSESAEVRGLMARVTLGDYLAPATARTGLTGAAAELNAALGVELAGKNGGPALPFQVLIGAESRALDRGQRENRALTTTANNDGQLVQRPILRRLFGPGILDTLGVRVDSVPVGKTEWPLITGGPTPAQRAEGTALPAATAVTFDFATLRPKRLSDHLEFTYEMVASVSGLEEALRLLLADSIKSKMSDTIINGPAVDANDDTTKGNISGFLTAITAPADAGATAVYSDYASSHAVFDGIHANTEREVSSLVAVDVLKHAASVFQAGSGESGSEAMERRSMSCRSSSYISAAVAGQSKGNLYHLSGPNGGGVMRGDSVAGVWPTIELIRDDYSMADEGAIKITWIMLWDFRAAFRAAAYQRLAFKIT